MKFIAIIQTYLYLLKLTRRDLITNKILNGFSLADHRDLITFNEDFRRSPTGIIITRHAETVSARAHRGQVLAFLDPCQYALLRKEIAAFADRADDINLLAAFIPADQRNDLMMSFI